MIHFNLSFLQYLLFASSFSLLFVCPGQAVSTPLPPFVMRSRNHDVTAGDESINNYVSVTADLEHRSSEFDYGLKTISMNSALTAFHPIIPLIFFMGERIQSPLLTSRYLLQ